MWRSAYIDTELDDIDGDGFGLSGSFALNETLFLNAGYANQDFDFGLDLDQWSAGIGAHTSINSAMDLVGSISYVDAEVDTRFGSFDDDGFGLRIGLRGFASNVAELEGGINHVDLDESGDETSIYASARYYIADNVSVGIGVEVGDDLTQWQIGGRINF